MPAKVVVSLNNAPQGEFILNKEKTIIGRRPDCDITIDNLAVSGRHALIITVLDDSFLEDLGSTNGTYVNGKLIRKSALKDGDVIGIGKHQLRYVNKQAVVDEDVEKTIIITPASATAAAAHAKMAEQAGAKPNDATMTDAQVGRLKLLSGPGVGKEMPLTKALVTLGKPGMQVAVISRRPQGYFLTHIESGGDGKRYPVVNGSPIGPKAYPLKDSDKIELAGIQMQFSMPAA